MAADMVALTILSLSVVVGEACRVALPLHVVAPPRGSTPPRNFGALSMSSRPSHYPGLRRAACGVLCPSLRCR